MTEPARMQSLVASLAVRRNTTGYFTVYMCVLDVAGGLVLELTVNTWKLTDDNDHVGTFDLEEKVKVRYFNDFALHLHRRPEHLLHDALFCVSSEDATQTFHVCIL